MFSQNTPIGKTCEHNLNKRGREPLGNATKALCLLVSDKKIVSCFPTEAYFKHVNPLGPISNPRSII